MAFAPIPTADQDRTKAAMAGRNMATRIAAGTPAGDPPQPPPLPRQELPGYVAGHPVFHGPFTVLGQEVAGVQDRESGNGVQAAADEPRSISGITMLEPYTSAVSTLSVATVPSPITWPQLIGGWLSDFINPVVTPAILGVVLNWLQSSEPLTWRAGITVLVLAILAGYQAALHITNSDGLARRLKAMGQIKQ